MSFREAWILTAALLIASPASAQTVVDRSSIERSIAALTDTSLGGREVGGPGIAAAGEYIAGAFREAGLAPAFGENYFQEFRAKDLALRNVGGIIRGSRRPGQAVVLGAHFDGLRRDPEGRVRMGADDNASGVAVMLEVARRAAADAGAGKPPARTLIFVAFTGEEEGLLGSSEYVRHPAAPLDSTVAMVNLDTVGRLRQDKLLVFGAGSADEFNSMLDGLNLSAGFQLEKIPEDSGGSDQVSFYAQRIPSLHFFTGPHEDYHRAGDTAEKLNVQGMERIADFAYETVSYLGRRREPLTFRLLAPKRLAGERTERRVTLGAIPDFAYSGPGVMLSGVMPGSPAERAGLQSGDVVLQVGGDNVEGLEDLQAALKSRRPGDIVTVVYRRGDREGRVDVSLAERR